jgi:hypothetical protein
MSLAPLNRVFRYSIHFSREAKACVKMATRSARVRALPWKPVAASIPFVTPCCPLVVQLMTPIPSDFNSRPEELGLRSSAVSADLKSWYLLRRGQSCSGSFMIASSRFGKSVINPSVVTDTILPPSACMLWRHSPITDRMKAVVIDARMGFDSSVPTTL